MECRSALVNSNGIKWSLIVPIVQDPLPNRIALNSWERDKVALIECFEVKVLCD